jgi:hypothetical protein
MAKSPWEATSWLNGIMAKEAEEVEEEAAADEFDELDEHC